MGFGTTWNRFEEEENEKIRKSYGGEKILAKIMRKMNPNQETANHSKDEGRTGH